MGRRDRRRGWGGEIGGGGEEAIQCVHVATLINTAT